MHAERPSSCEAPGHGAEVDGEADEGETSALDFSVDVPSLSDLTGLKELTGTEIIVDEYEQQVISAMRMGQQVKMTRLEEYCSELQEELMTLRGDMAGLEAWSGILVAALVEHAIAVPDRPGTQYLGF